MFAYLSILSSKHIQCKLSKGLGDHSNKYKYLHSLTHLEQSHQNNYCYGR